MRVDEKISKTWRTIKVNEINYARGVYPEQRARTNYRTCRKVRIFAIYGGSFAHIGILPQ